MATTLQISGQVPPVGERRSSPRRKIDQLIYVSFGADNGGYLLDVGEGGLSCRAVGALIQGEMCRPKFQLPGIEGAIEAECLIIWTNESRKVGGLKFVSLPEEALLKIRGWIAQAPLDKQIRTIVAATKMNPIQFGSNERAIVDVPPAPANGTKRTDPAPPQPAPQVREPKPLPTAIEPIVEPIIEPIKPPPAIPKSISKPLSVPDSSVVPTQPRPQRDVLTQPQPRTIKFTPAKAIAAIGLLAALLALVYHYGRIIGFEHEAARVSKVNTLAVSAEPTEFSNPDPALPDRPLDPSGIVPLTPPAADTVSNSASRRSNSSAGERAEAVSAHRSVAVNGSANKPKLIATSDQRRVPSVESMQPPHLGQPLGADPSSAATALAIAPANPAAVDPRAFPFNPVGNSVPAKPQVRGTVFPAALQAPVLIKRVEPDYPPLAKASGVEGTVEVSATIGKDGVPHDLAVTKGDPQLSGAAMDAVRKWRYQPALSGAYVSEAPITITIEFRIQK